AEPLSLSAPNHGLLAFLGRVWLGHCARPGGLCMAMAGFTAGTAGTAAKALRARQAWHMLQGGVLCFFKPNQCPLPALQDQISRQLTQELNRIHAQDQWHAYQHPTAVTADFATDLDQLGPAPPSYQRHPLALGAGFEPSDLFLHVVNPLPHRVGGVVLSTINHAALAHQIERAQCIRTYRVEVQLGRGTRTGFADGPVQERSRNPFLRRSQVDRILATIQSNYQRDAFDFAQVRLDSQAAYELAARGPIRPQMDSHALIYHCKCVQFEDSRMELEFSCINEDEDFILGFIQDLSLKLKTNATIHRMRCIRYGFFTLDHALLVKHATLSHVLTHTWIMPKVGILTVSDSVSQGQSVDRSGPILKDLVQDNADWTVMEQKCLPDENDQIQACLLAWSSPPLGLDLILTTGGTGFGPRDVTPEATEAILEKKAPGLVHRMMSQSLEVTPMAMLSRLSAGSRGQSLIINFPGSPKACRQCFRFVLPALGHAMDLLSGRIDQVRQLHGQMHGLATVSGCGHACAKPANGPPESTGVVGRPRKSPYPMIEVSQAQALVMANCAVLEVVEIASDGKGKRKVIGGITAGAQEEASISPGRCMRINTGAPIPKGADAVVQVEDTLLSQASADGEEELEIEILTMPQIGQDIRPIGSDIQSGSTVLNKYAVLSAAERGLLATVGVTRVQTFRNPVVSLLSTGNELQDPSDRQPLKPGFIRDSNKSTLTALLREHRFECFDAGIAIDDPEVLEAKLKLALEHGDIVVTTGSVSMGDRDILRQVLVSKFGAQIHFARVNMKPGKPTTFATLEYLGKTKRVLGLPGNPVSATVTAQLYLLPACRQMAGYLNPVPATVRAQLSQDLPLDPRPEYHRAVIRWDRGQAVAMASTTGNQISSRLLSLHAANALLMFPMRSEERNTLKAGEEVDALIIGQLIA
ncbi:hypothetical protein TCAL_08967, partial [Tigriopus californicus]